jgi:adenine-specific DNA-methyltransferase
VFIDPPYNTGNAFEHYDDGLEHSIWLSLMKNRIELIHSLLCKNGSLWITIDDAECHYLKIVCDEIFGRNNYVTSTIWQKVFARKNKALISSSHDYILVYAKDIDSWTRNLIPREGDQLKAFKNPDNDPRGKWQSVSYSVQSEDSEKRKAYRYEITLPNGKVVSPPPGRHWNGLPERTETLKIDNRLWFGPNGDRAPRAKVFLSEVQDGIVPDTWWKHEEYGNNQEAKKEMLNLFPDTEPFPTPKPERLLSKIIQIASDEGDLVLDSFLGSGTSAAVAHKLKRHWIGIELGNHCYSHCKPRMDKVVSGEDNGGITTTSGWQGGGGYKFYELAPSLLNKDTYGNWIINKQYNANMLAAAMAKQEGFKYSPDPDIYWKQGQSTEQDFIFTTTEFLTQEHVEFIRSQMKEGESLLICCKAFNTNDSHFPNITIKKIPKMLMGKCEFGKDDYSLNIINIPRDDSEEDVFDPVPESKPKYIAGQAELFDLEGDNE